MTPNIKNPIKRYFIYWIELVVAEYLRTKADYKVCKTCGMIGLKHRMINIKVEAQCCKSDYQVIEGLYYCIHCLKN